MALVWWMVGLNLGIGLAYKLLNLYQENQLYKSEDLTELSVMRKCLTMDYQQLETQEIMDRKVRAVEGKRMVWARMKFRLNWAFLVFSLRMNLSMTSGPPPEVYEGVRRLPGHPLGEVQRHPAGGETPRSGGCRRCPPHTSSCLLR